MVFQSRILPLIIVVIAASGCIKKTYQSASIATSPGSISKLAFADLGDQPSLDRKAKALKTFVEELILRNADKIGNFELGRFYAATQEFKFFLKQLELDFGNPVVLQQGDRLVRAVEKARSIETRVPAFLELMRYFPTLVEQANSRNFEPWAHASLSSLILQFADIDTPLFPIPIPDELKKKSWQPVDEYLQKVTGVFAKLNSCHSANIWCSQETEGRYGGKYQYIFAIGEGWNVRSMKTRYDVIPSTKFDSINDLNTLVYLFGNDLGDVTGMEMKGNHLKLPSFQEYSNFLRKLNEKLETPITHAVESARGKLANEREFINLFKNGKILLAETNSMRFHDLGFHATSVFLPPKLFRLAGEYLNAYDDFFNEFANEPKVPDKLRELFVGRVAWMIDSTFGNLLSVIVWLYKSKDEGVAVSDYDFLNKAIPKLIQLSDGSDMRPLSLFLGGSQKSALEGLVKSVFSEISRGKVNVGLSETEVNDAKIAVEAVLEKYAAFRMNDPKFTSKSNFFSTTISENPLKTAVYTRRNELRKAASLLR